MNVQSPPGEDEGAPLTSVKAVSGKKAARARKPSAPGKPERQGAGVPVADLPFGESIGYQIRTTHRAMQRFLQSKIEPHGITLGMWYFLRALWHEDGLTQSELSRRVGASKPTTLAQLRRMELRGLIRFVRRNQDKRHVTVRLTPEGRSLKLKLLPIARFNHNAALAGFKKAEIEILFSALRRIRQNVAKRGAAF